MITVATQKTFTLYGKIFFCGGHVYTVVGVKEKTIQDKTYKYITVRNPYAGRSRDYVQKKDGKFRSRAIIHKNAEQKGYSDIELNDFLNYFSYITIEK